MYSNGKGKHYWGTDKDLQYGMLVNDGLDDILNNCKFYINDKDKLCVRTVRDIEPGEGIFIAYGKEYWDNLISKDIISHRLEREARLYYAKKSKSNSSNAVDDFEEEYVDYVENNYMYTCNTTISDKQALMLDNGANVTVIRDRDLMNRIRRGTRTSIQGVSGSIESNITGNLIEPFSEIEGIYMPESTANVLSQKDLMKSHKLSFESDNNRYVATNDEGKMVVFESNGEGNYMYESNYNKLAYVATEMHGTRFTKVQMERADKVKELHKELGHVSYKIIRDMITGGSIRTKDNLVGTDVDNCVRIHGKCIGCLLGKMTHEATKKKNTREPASRMGQVLHTDIMFIKRNKGVNYIFLIVIDEYSGRISSIQLGNREGVTIKKGLEGVINKYAAYGKAVNEIRMDREGGYLSLKEWLSSINIVASYSVADGHVKRAERSIRTVKDRFRAVLLGLRYKLPTSLYPELILYVVSNSNRVKNINSANRTPEEMLTGATTEQQGYSFGEVVIAKVPYSTGIADDRPRGQIAIILGTSTETRGGICMYTLKSKRHVVRREFQRVNITEDIIQELGALDMEEIRNESMYTDNNNEEVSGEDEEELEVNSVNEGEHNMNEFDNNVNRAAENPNDYNIETTNEEYDATANINMNDNNDEDDDEEESVKEVVVVPQEIRTSGRARKQPDRYAYVAQEGNLGMISTGNMTIRQGILESKKKAEHAVIKEITQMEQRDVWDYVLPEKHKEVTGQRIPSSIFLKNKFHADGSFDKMKARLVAGGHKEVVDDLADNEFASPTANIHVLFICLEIICKLGMRFRCIDVTGAYLHAELPLDKDIHMYMGEQLSKIITDIYPERKIYIGNNNKMLVKLKKCLYGLKESSREWYLLIAKVLKETCEMIRCEMDMCLFRVYNKEVELYALLYVDDILVFYNKESDYESFMSNFKTRFNEVTETQEGNVSFLGNEIFRDDSNNIKVRNAEIVNKTIKKILSENEMHLTCDTPCLHRKNNEEDEKIMTTEERKKTLGAVMSLLYLSTRSRPDISYQVVEAASGVHKGKMRTWFECKRIAKYLNGTKDLCKTHMREGEIKLVCHADAAFDSHEGSKGHTGIVIWLDNNKGSACVINKSCRQKVPVNSSMEAELIALGEAANLVVWCQQILSFFNNVPVQKGTVIFQDNKANISINKSEFASLRGRCKFIDRKYFVTKDKIEQGKIQLEWCKSGDMTADVDTKNLDKAMYESCRRPIMGMEEGAYNKTGNEGDIHQTAMRLEELYDTRDEYDYNEHGLYEHRIGKCNNSGKKCSIEGCSCHLSSSSNSVGSSSKHEERYQGYSEADSRHYDVINGTINEYDNRNISNNSSVSSANSINQNDNSNMSERINDGDVTVTNIRDNDEHTGVYEDKKEDYNADVVHNCYEGVLSENNGNNYENLHPASEGAKSKKTVADQSRKSKRIKEQQEMSKGKNDD